MTDFTEEELRRYDRNILLSEVGRKGQKKINGARVLMVGSGGLGSPVGYYLAAAGVGKIGIIDDDQVELSNLQRQIVHSTPNLGKNKAISAKEALLALNPGIEVITYQERATPKNFLDILEGYEIVVDCTDNFPTRYLINDACVITRKPFAHGAVLRFHGQTMTIVPGEGPCYRCLFREPPPPGVVPSCQEVGIMGVVPGLIGAIQATEVLKLILGTGKLLKGRLLIYEGLDMEFKDVTIQRDLSCPVCGDNPTITELMDYEEFCRMN